MGSRGVGESKWRQGEKGCGGGVGVESWGCPGLAASISAFTNRWGEGGRPVKERGGEAKEQGSQRERPGLLSQASTDCQAIGEGWLLCASASHLQRRGDISEFAQPPGNVLSWRS